MISAPLHRTCFRMASLEYIYLPVQPVAALCFRVEGLAEAPAEPRRWPPKRFPVQLFVGGSGPLIIAELGQRQERSSVGVFF